MRLPDVIAVGPQRTGTTWLHKVLFRHVGLPTIKETDFFWTNYEKGIDWYLRHFENCRADRPIVEVAPNYFACIEASERVSHDIPHCKIICSLRDPVQRAYSHYRLMNRDGWARGSFEETASNPFIQESNRYAFHLKNWQARLGKDQVFVCLYDDLETNPQGYLDRICEFTGIPRIIVEGTSIEKERVHTVTHRPRNRWIADSARKAQDRMRMRNWHRAIHRLEKLGLWSVCFGGGDEYPPLDAGLERRLRQQLRPEIEALEKLIDRDLSLWK